MDTYCSLADHLSTEKLTSIGVGVASEAFDPNLDDGCGYLAHEKMMQNLAEEAEEEGYASAVDSVCAKYFHRRLRN